MSEGRRLGRVVRADGAVEDITFALTQRKRRFHSLAISAVDFRTTDGEKLVLGPHDRLEVPLDGV